jgi:hypothetical protein
MYMESSSAQSRLDSQLAYELTKFVNSNAEPILAHLNVCYEKPDFDKSCDRAALLDGRFNKLYGRSK